MQRRCVPCVTNAIRSSSREHTIIKTKQNNFSCHKIFSIKIVMTLIDTITLIRCRSTSRPTVNQRASITGIFPWVWLIQRRRRRRLQRRRIRHWITRNLIAIITTTTANLTNCTLSNLLIALRWLPHPAPSLTRPLPQSHHLRLSASIRNFNSRRISKPTANRINFTSSSRPISVFKIHRKICWLSLIIFELCCCCCCCFCVNFIILTCHY